MKEKIKEFRVKKLLSQKELAKLSGISRSYISELEDGKYDPTAKKICMLCKALECSPNDLLMCDYRKEK